MKLISLNIGIRLQNTSKIVDFLNQQDADFIALQEVVRHLEDDVEQKYRTKYDIEQALNKDYAHTFFGPTWVAEGFKKADHANTSFGGHIEQGCELLSKYPITGGTNEFYYKHFEYMQDWSRWRQEDHGRSLLITQLEVNEKPLQILNLHGIWTSDKLGDERTQKQCEYIVEVANRLDIPTIIAGDINLLPSSDSLQILNRSFRNLAEEFNASVTRPTFKDEVEHGGGTVDYIFVNDLIKVNDFIVEKTEISDHYPLIVDFDPL